MNQQIEVEHAINKTFIDEIYIARNRYHCFINNCQISDSEFRFTQLSEASPYALCFAIFGYGLLDSHHILKANSLEWSNALFDNLIRFRLERVRVADLGRDKAYLQLLCFTLSALDVLKTLPDYTLSAEVLEVIPKNIAAALLQNGCLYGLPRSGNHAMFLGILLIYSNEYLGFPMQCAIDTWVSMHRAALNRFGFWSSSRTMSHLQFQNGYHQYEIFDYLDSSDIPWDLAAGSVADLVDDEGHFAPYPGGGGCYDYDAVFLLTARQKIATRYHDLLINTAHSILSSQNQDGGFCESHYVRPISMNNMRRSVMHIMKGKGQAKIERLRAFISLSRPKNSRIKTHWTTYSREWSESNLWDSWFRMMAVAKIQTRLVPHYNQKWGFLKFPGIGYKDCD